MCRSRANALSAFQEGVQALAVKGTPWDVQQPVSAIAIEIDAHISKLRAQKVTLTAHTLCGCRSISLSYMLLSQTCVKTCRVGLALLMVLGWACA